MKIFKRKHFQALIYSIFLSLPLLSVLGRCVYTIVNKNAYENYSGKDTNPKENLMITNRDEIDINSKYYLSYTTEYSPRQYSEGSDYIMCSTLYYNDETYENIRLGLYGNTTYVAYIYVRDLDTNEVKFNFQLSNNNITKVWFMIDDLSQDLTSTDLAYIGLKTIIYEDNYYLDNAFEYSIDRFVSENDYGELDFFTWFSSLFLSGNSLDSLYIHFINWYMNYILYVSLGYLIFSVLLWFVNFFRRLVDDTENINVGGM